MVDRELILYLENIPLRENQVHYSLFLDFFIFRVSFPFLRHFLIHLCSYNAISPPSGMFLLHYTSIFTSLSLFIHLLYQQI